MTTGIAFDPASTASNLILWISNTTFGFNSMADWGGKITRISGANLENVQDYVVGLPRSIRDHVTNGVAFGPDGALYVNQGSNSAMGNPDGGWGNRPERLLSAANLRVDIAAITSPPLNVKSNEGGTYNPFAPGAQVTVFGSGIRNAYDLVWHSNGNLYIPANGSAGNNDANSPTVNVNNLPQECSTNRVDLATNGAYTGPSVQGYNAPTQDDFLFRVPAQGGTFHGHPNPTRCEWVLNGGNPTSGDDPAEAGKNNKRVEYPVGTMPDRNYAGFAFDFERNKSPNGVIEYRSNTFGGKLQGWLLVVRYSQNDDIIALLPGGANKDIVADVTGIPGFTGFKDPLDLIEDTRTGIIYLSEYDQSGGSPKLVMLAPKQGAAAPNIAVDDERLIFEDIAGGAASAAQTVVVNNNGTASLSVSATIVGADASQFQITTAPAASVDAGGATTIDVVFNPTTKGVKVAALQITSNDPDQPTITVELRGLGKQGTGGANEPSLQWIFDTLDIPINVGDDDSSTNIIHSNPAFQAVELGDEIPVQRFEKAGTGNVDVELLAVYGPTNNNPVTAFGWYPTGDGSTTNELFTVSNNPTSNGQRLLPPLAGVTSFDPADASFGFYSRWPFFGNRLVYSEDALNTWEAASKQHKVRVYQLKERNGQIVPNAYVLATEETTSGFDYQDVVVIVRNVAPAGATEPELSVAPTQLIFSGVKGTTSAAQTVTINNTGDAVLTVSSLNITGNNAADFSIVDAPSLPLNIPAGASYPLSVAFTPGADTVGSLDATLTILNNDANESNFAVELYGLSANGEQGNNEPPLQSVVNTLGYPIDVGGTSLILGTNPAPIGDEVNAPLFQKAGPGNVTLVPVARYSPDGLLPFGYYTLNAGNPALNEVAVVGLNQEQTLNPAIQSGGGDSFNPGNTAFGIYVDSKSFGRVSYTQDGLNTGPTAHAARIYPLKNRSGQPIANTYLVAFEDASNGDYQDYVFVLTNARPAGSGGGNTTAKVNFQPDGSVVPDGYTKDAGLPFNATRGFGWVQIGTSTPIDMSANSRERNAISDQRLDTLILMQGNGGANQPNQGAWEYVLPNGSYEVTLAVGDPSFTDSQHRIDVEGVSVFALFAPSDDDGLFATATVTVNVADGKLTLTPTGINTKIDYVDIVSLAATGPDTTAPTATIDVSGTTAAGGAYKNVAQVTITATDDNSGVKSVSYSLDGGVFQPYSGPFAVTGTGSHSVVARAVDNAGNITTTPQTTFSIVVSNAEIELQNLDGIPYPDRLVFSRIQNPNASNKFHNEATLRVKNTGSDPLEISALTISGPWEFVSPIALPATVAPGGQLDIALRFIATGNGSGNGMWQGTLTIISDDADEATSVVALGGFWQSVSEGGQEPTNQEILKVFGYTTNIGSGKLSEKPTTPLVGNEVRSPLWKRADSSKSVYVRQLAAYHGCCTAQDSFQITGSGGGSFKHAGAWGQSLLPLKDNSSDPAEMTINPTSSQFEIKVAGYSTNTGGNLGVRTFALYDRDGNIVPNAYFVVQDFVQNGCGAGSANCDYNDNVYIVTNIAPATAPAVPTGLTAMVAGGNIVLDWADNSDAVAGYNVFRSTSAAGPFAKLNTSLLTNSAYTDAGVAIDTVFYYYVVAVAANGVMSPPSAQVNGAITTPPAAPTSLTATVAGKNVKLDWANNSEPDLAGYNVYRSTDAAGPFTKLNNTSLVGGSDFTDLNAAANTTYYYYVTAVDDVGSESSPSNQVSAIVVVAVTPTPIASVTATSVPPTATATSVPPTSAIRINAGGPAVTTGGVTWSADQFFQGGKSYTNNSIADIANTSDDAIYKSERSAAGTFSYAIPVANGTYTVQLHLAEIYWGATGGGANGAGKRVFSANLEGGPVELANYDINAAVGPMAAVVKSYQVTVTDGVLNIAFTASVDQPKVSAIAVLGAGAPNPTATATATATVTSVPPTATATATATVTSVPPTATATATATVTSVPPTATATATTPPAPATAIRINAGGPAQTVGGVTWQGCTSGCSYVTGGFTYGENDTISNVQAPANQTIYQSEWTGGQSNGVPAGQTAFTFEVPVSNGTYSVRLHFAELNKFANGKRVFDVNVEGTSLKRYDIYAAVGADVATVKEFPVTVTDGGVTIAFTRQIENAKVSAIEIVSTGGAGN